jgi:hypothetical protein
LRALDQIPNVRTLPLAAHFCDAESCRVALGAIPLYFDDSHLSASGAREIVDVFEAAFP